MKLYKMCTISWLSFYARPLQVVGVMQGRVLVLLSAVFLMAVKTTPTLGQDKIQAFVSRDGNVVFTNLVDNAPMPVDPVLTQTTDVLAREMPTPLKTLVDTIANTHGVDPGLVRAVMKTESNFNRWAVSKKGALGLMQLIPETGRRYGVRDFFDPQQNVDGGVRYLKFLLQKFNGNIDLSIAAYNAGENLVAKLGRIPPIPETTNYVRKVRAIYKKKSPSVTPAMIAAAISDETTNETPQIFRRVDEYGVIHFSNVGPPN
jgi:hypothetical protein